LENKGFARGLNFIQTSRANMRSSSVFVQFRNTAVGKMLASPWRRTCPGNTSLWVLGRSGFADVLAEVEWLDLSAVDLRRADLRHGRLAKVLDRPAHDRYPDPARTRWTNRHRGHCDSKNDDTALNATGSS